MTAQILDMKLSSPDIVEAQKEAAQWRKTLLLKGIPADVIVRKYYGMRKWTIVTTAKPGV